MGWCSGTDIFDTVVCEVLKLDISEVAREKIVSTLIDAMEDRDWDCQSDSMYYDHPLVQGVLRELHPDWEELFEEN